jgi:hypothetical protein
MNSCMTKCSADPTCNGFSWQLDVGQVGKGVPKDGETLEYGTCHFRTAADAKGDLAPYYDSGRDFAAKLPAGVSTVPTLSTAASPPTFTAPATLWSPNKVCANGGSDTAGGKYLDRFGAVWEVRCQSGFDVVSSEDVGTNSQGIYSCWKGCNNRPECSSFVYDGTVDGSMCRDYHYFAAINANVLLSESAHWNRQMSLQARSRCGRELHSRQ